MNKSVVPVAFACIVTIFALDQQSVAADSQLKPVLGLGVGGEYSTWREQDPSGSTLLRESGPRGTLSLSLDNLGRTKPGFIYDIGVRGYIGDENYDGQTQTAIPITSNTGYFGGAAELGGGYRFTDVLPTYSVDLAAAVGADKWRRKISDTTTAKGDFVNGSEENYRIIYARLGLGLHHINGSWSHYVQFGVKRPFNTREEASLPIPIDCSTSLTSVVETFVLNPKGAESFYLKWRVDRLSDNKQRKYSVSFYYDSYQFNRSNTAFGQVTGCPAHQPDSHQNIFGAQVGYYFNMF